ncbi:MAG: ArnT family glycosyltransferase [bacterium]
MNSEKRKKIPQRIYLFAIIAIIIISSWLRFTGFNWGLPQKPYYRAGYQDESFVINLILRMDPEDFNLHYFINPSFHYYTLSIAMKIGHLFGYVKSFAQPVTTNLQGQPVEKIILADYQKLYIIGRIITVIEGVLTVLLVYLIGLKLYDKRTGLIASFIFAILPTPVYQSHFFVVDSPALFWSNLALLYIVTATRKKHISITWFIVSGILLGLALGTKYMNLLMVFPLIMIFLLKARKMGWKYILLSVIVMFVVFVFTTPHCLLSFRQFLFGGPDEFGGIFGAKGLFAYNNYPANPIKPFGYIFYYSLRLPLAILALLCIGYTIYRRNTADKILLSFMAPFYLIMAISPSPHLRHSLPAMSFIALIIGSAITGLIEQIKNRYLLYIFVCYSAGAFLFTFLFTLAMVDRMKYPDTRYEFANWMFKNVPAGTKLAAPTVMPFRYTPPIENPGYDGKEIAPQDYEVMGNLYYYMRKTNYNYKALLQFAPEYFFITETEYKELPYNELGKVNGRKFVSNLSNQTDYQLVKVFERKFDILGIKFEPLFPNMDWNPVSQKIYLFKKKF